MLIVDLYLWCADPASACYSDILSFESTNRKCETFKVTALHCCFLKSHFLKKKGMLDETFWDTIFFFSAFNSIIHNTYTHIYTL